MPTNLKDLLMLLQGGVLEPQQAVGQAMEMEERKRQEALAAQQGQMEGMQSLYGDLSGMAMEGAQEGMPLESLYQQMNAASQFAGTGLDPQMGGQLEQGLQSLYYPIPMKAAGMSRLNPQLSPSDVNDVSAIVQEEMNSGMMMADPQVIREDIHEVFRDKYGPTAFRGLMPSLDALIDKAFKSRF